MILEIIKAYGFIYILIINNCFVSKVSQVENQTNNKKQTKDITLSNGATWKNKRTSVSWQA